VIEPIIAGNEKEDGSQDHDRWPCWCARSNEKAQRRGQQVARAGRPCFRPIHPGRIVKRKVDALGNTARFWLNLQANFDAWHAERDGRKLKIGRLQTAS
jgi:hypothetical protein